MENAELSFVDQDEEGRIDAFLFTSATESYLAAVMDSL